MKTSIYCRPALALTVLLAALLGKLSPPKVREFTLRPAHVARTSNT
jgi:Mg/Co/Ni transporter MgtE